MAAAGVRRQSASERGASAPESGRSQGADAPCSERSSASPAPGLALGRVLAGQRRDLALRQGPVQPLADAVADLEQAEAGVGPGPLPHLVPAAVGAVLLLQLEQDVVLLRL